LTYCGKYLLLSKNFVIFPQRGEEEEAIIDEQQPAEEIEIVDENGGGKAV
jgi:hypothetical protein